MMMRGDLFEPCDDLDWLMNIWSARESKDTQRGRKDQQRLGHVVWPNMLREEIVKLKDGLVEEECGIGVAQIDLEASITTFTVIVICNGLL